MIPTQHTHGTAISAIGANITHDIRQKTAGAYDAADALRYLVAHKVPEVHVLKLRW